MGNHLRLLKKREILTVFKALQGDQKAVIVTMRIRYSVNEAVITLTHSPSRISLALDETFAYKVERNTSLN